jgi:F-type H+-transporting ATPase subunit b
VITVTVTATAAGHTVVVNVPQTTGEAETTAEDKGPSPIAPEVKELAWGAGAFVVLFVLMRLVLFPRLKKGMDARYGKIRGDHETAESIRANAKADLAAYEAELAKVKAEARQRIDAARQTLESERAAALAEANARIAARRAEAMSAAEAARAAATEQNKVAVADVSSLVSELAVGRRPDPAAVTGIVSTLMAGGVK